MSLPVGREGEEVFNIPADLAQEHVSSDGWPWLIKRYLMANYEIHIHLWLDGAGDESAEYCTFFVRAVEKLKAAEGGPNVGGQPAEEPCRSADRQVERAVIARPLEGTTVCVQSVERLQPLDECLCIQGDAKAPGSSDLTRGMHPSLSPEAILGAVRVELNGSWVQFWADEPVNHLLQSIGMCLHTREFHEGAIEL